MIIKGITLNSYNSPAASNVVKGLSFSAIGIWWYTFFKSKDAKYLKEANPLTTSSIRGMGNPSFSVNKFIV